MYGRRLSVWKWHVLTNRLAADSIRLWFNKHEGGHMNHCWLNGIEASLQYPLTSTSLLTISSLIEDRIIEMDEQRCTYISTPPSEGTRWNAITYNPYNDELQREWLKQSSRCTLMHAHARSCMQMDGMHGVGPQWACICTHLHAYALLWIHMHSYACRVSLGWGSGRASACICTHVYP